MHAELLLSRIGPQVAGLTMDCLLFSAGSSACMSCGAGSYANSSGGFGTHSPDTSRWHVSRSIGLSVHMLHTLNQLESSIALAHIITGSPIASALLCLLICVWVRTLDCSCT